MSVVALQTSLSGAVPKWAHPTGTELLQPCMLNKSCFNNNNMLRFPLPVIFCLIKPVDKHSLWQSHGGFFARCNCAAYSYTCSCWWLDTNTGLEWPYRRGRLQYSCMDSAVEIFSPPQGSCSSVAKWPKFRPQVTKGAEKNCMEPGKWGAELLEDLSGPKRGRTFFWFGFALKQ
jgi:hypothetical protein